MPESGTGERECRVLIIGAGIIGCSIAYHLTQLGQEGIITVEKESEPGLGSTTKATGGIRAQFTTEINIRMSLKSMEILERLQNAAGNQSMYKPAGYLFVTADEERFNAMARAVVFQRSLGVSVELLSGDDVRRMAPYIHGDDIVGGSFGRRDGFIDPDSLINFLKRASSEAGVRYLFNSEATRIMLNQAGQFLVAAGKERILADKVVNAAGARAAQIASMLGVELPVEPVRRQIVVSNPCFDIPEQSPMTVDADSGVLIRRFGDRVLIAYANPDEPPGFDESFDPAFVDRIAEPVERRFPLVAAAGYDLGRCRAGLYAVTPDHHAILGEAPEVEGFYLANGFSGHGNMHSPAVGLCMAELISTGRSESLDISPLGPMRFERGEMIHETMVL